MALVDYSDSDSSESDKTPVIKTATHTTKNTFQKVVERSNPGKIRVSLPRPVSRDEAVGDGPPTKRVKTGGGGFTGFNSFLPPPKRTNPVPTGALGPGNTAMSNGLVVGISLRTGDGPGFNRGSELDYNEPESHGQKLDYTSGRSDISDDMADQLPEADRQEINLIGKPLMFKPLSVSRKPTKKNKPVDLPAPKPANLSISSTAAKVELQPQRRTVSLFSVPTEPSKPDRTPPLNGQYQPLIYGTREENGLGAKVEDRMDTAYDSSSRAAQHVSQVQVAPQVGAQSLNDIASDLRLSAAERRQLFGRQKGNRNGGLQSATKVINFNTDEEYKHNEELRAAGEQVVHNPVRAIAPGKHNLKQLVNAAASQKEALEESFAKGKNNRAEASSRYGW